MANLLDKCAECGQDFYGTHFANCSKEADLDMCGVCDRFYHNQGKTINNQCVCEREKVMTCDNCDAGNSATHTVITTKGELALCESCYND